MIKINQVDEIHWRLNQLEECDKAKQIMIDKLDAEFDKSIDRIYDKLDKYNYMLITSLISSLLTLVVIVFMVVGK